MPDISKSNNKSDAQNDKAKDIANGVPATQDASRAVPAEDEGKGVQPYVDPRLKAAAVANQQRNIITGSEEERINLLTENDTLGDKESDALVKATQRPSNRFVRG